MKFCSTCLSFCPPPPPISTKNEAKGVVVSGEFVFLEQNNPTQDYGQFNAEYVKRNSAQDNDPETKLVFVSRFQPSEMQSSPPKNSELFQMPIPTNQLVEFQSPISILEFQPPVQEEQAQALGVQERFQSPIPIKETLGQFQSNSLIQKAQMLDQRQNWSQSVWDIPPSTSATPLPYEQINFETSKEPSPPPEQIVFGAGFMSIRRPDGVPSSMDGVEISQSPSQVDKSIQNESRYPSPTPSPKTQSGGDKAVRYLFV